MPKGFLGLHFMDSKMPIRSGDNYHIEVVQRAPVSWGWEIHRNGEPLPVPLRDGYYKSKTTAGAAGRVALREFLEALDREQNA